MESQPLERFYRYRNYNTEHKPVHQGKTSFCYKVYPFFCIRKLPDIKIYTMIIALTLGRGIPGVFAGNWLYKE